MVILSLGQFFTGGGIAIDVAILSAIMATQVGRPLKWWKKITAPKLRKILAAIWPWTFILFILLSALIFVLTIAGINSKACQQAILIIAGILFFPIIFSVLGAFSQQTSES